MVPAPFRIVDEFSVGTENLGTCAIILPGEFCWGEKVSEKSFLPLEKGGPLEEAVERPESHPGTLLYSQGNGWLALEEFEVARDRYLEALVLLTEAQLRDCAAQCCKNLGSALGHLGEKTAAREYYERSLELDPGLSEAHLALAIWHRRNGSDPRRTLEHLDLVAHRRDSPLPMSTVRGWRLEALFEIGDVDGAFREIQALLAEAERLDWVWGWCARQVFNQGRSSPGSAQRALQFWEMYLGVDPDNVCAKQERLLCLLSLRASGKIEDVDFDEFKSSAEELMKSPLTDTAFLWDRIGHWAQYEKNWPAAEEAYRKAFEIDESLYGYCLGTALNFLERFKESLPILKREVEQNQPDAMSWFQLAVANSGLEQWQQSIEAYRHAIKLDPSYDLAWFNLGGTYWKSGNLSRASSTWREAVRRFPDHPLAEHVRETFPEMLDKEPRGKEESGETKHEP